MSQFWEVYVDDLDIGEVVNISFLEDLVALDENHRELHDWHALARQAYADWDAPRADEKAGVRRDIAVRLGVLIDGLAGRWGAPGVKIGRIINLTCEFLSLSLFSQHDLQVCCGHWTHIFQSRKELSSFRSEVWGVMVNALTLEL